MRRYKFLLLCGRVIGLMHVSACEAAFSPDDQENGRISIVNDAAALAARVTYLDTEVPIDADGVGYPPTAPLSLAAGQAARAPVSLRLRGQVIPPTVGGQMLQATSVAIVGDLAVVSYSMVGAPYLGAIDVFDVSNMNFPILRSQAVFQNADIHAVSVSGQNVYVAQATDDTAFQSPAVLEVVRLEGTNLVLDGNMRMAMTSFVGTSTRGSATRAYATSGNSGALFVVDPMSFTLLDSLSLHDARWVDVAGGKVVVVQGTPGQIAVFDEATLGPLGTFPFSGADIAESKSTVQLVGGKAFIAAGTGGVQILSATTGTVVGSVPRPDPAALGLDPSVVVTNAAAVDEDLILIANGEAGVYLAQGSQDFSTTGSETAQTITMLGRLAFGSLQSVNHVAVRNHYLVIAAGLGGVKIVQVL